MAARKAKKKTAAKKTLGKKTLQRTRGGMVMDGGCDIKLPDLPTIRRQLA